MGAEGASNWNPNDRGNVVLHGFCLLPTYAGIAPAFHPTWKGWQYVKAAVASMRQMPKYDSPDFWRWKKQLDKVLAQSPALQSLVKAFYLSTFWNSNRLGDIESQEVANWIYDHAVNAGARGAKWAQLAAKVTPDGAIGPQSVAAINAIPAIQFLRRATDIAGAFRLDVASEHPSQIQFLSSWLDRDGQPPEIIAMVKAAARDGRLDAQEVAGLKSAMESVG